MKREFLETLLVGEEHLPEAVMDAILSEHQKAMSALRLESALDGAIARAGGRNKKAITALLDLEELGQKEDLTGALEAALGQLKKDSGYLFEEQTPPPYARFTGAVQPASGDAPTTLAGALRQRMKQN